MTHPYTIEELRDIITPIARKHGVKRVAVFGSYARGQATHNSDVDLFIEKGRIRTLVHLLSFQLETEEALKKHVDLITPDIRDKDFMLFIRPDEVTLYEQ